jgi:hypothetical protein
LQLKKQGIDKIIVMGLIAHTCLEARLLRCGDTRRTRLLRVAVVDDDGVIEVGEDRGMRLAPLGVVSGAVVGVLTALSAG